MFRAPQQRKLKTQRRFPNLLYRRFPIGSAPKARRPVGIRDVRRLEALRYSRLGNLRYDFVNGHGVLPRSAKRRVVLWSVLEKWEGDDFGEAFGMRRLVTLSAGDLSPSSGV